MQRRVRLWLVTLIGIVGLLLIFQMPLLRRVRGITWGFVVAMTGNVFRVGPLTVTNNVEEQMARLVAENARLRVESLDYSRLRQQLGSLAFDDYRGVPAEIRAAPLDSYRTDYVVNRGALDGIVLGAPAVVFGSTLVGMVVELAETTAVVRSLTHPLSQLPAQITEDETVTTGIVRGRSYTSVELTSIPRDVVLAAGQSVVTTSQETIVPAGLFVGTVSTVKADEHTPYQEAFISLPIPLQRVQGVMILVAP